MTITCVTVTYNGTEATLRLLRSLEHQTDADFAVIVVDNDSAPDEVERLRAFTVGTMLRIEVIESRANRGFSGGNNLAIRRALADGAEWVVLLNNDTDVDPGFVAELRTTLAGANGIVGLPLEEDGTLVRAGRLRWLALTLSHHPDPDDTTDAYAIGAGMAISRDVLERIGLLDEAYFLYFEDADYAARARYAGVTCTYAAGPVLRHAVSRSARELGAPLLARYHSRNAIRFNAKNGPWWVRALLVPWIAVIAARNLGKWLVGRDRRRAEAVLAGIADAATGRWGIIDQRIPIGIECASLEGPTWGLGRLVASLIDALGEREGVRQRFRITLYSNGPLPTSLHFDERLCVPRPLGLSRLLGRWAPSSFSAYYFLLLPLALRRDRPRAVFYPAYMLPIGAPPGSLVLLTDDVFREVEDAALPVARRMLYRAFSLGWARRHATRIMTISRSSAEHLAARGVPASRITVNPLGVDPARVDVTPAPPSTFLWVGQAFPRRHLRETLQAFARIAAAEPATFRVIGPDRYRQPTVADLVDQLNRRLGRPAVRWEPYVTDDELAAAYRSAGAIVYVSETEAFGLPPLEALTYGTPAVLADTPVNRELYGPHAFYVPVPVTEAGIAAAMTASMRDLATREKIRAAATSITDRYTWAAHAQRFLTTMGELASS